VAIVGATVMVVPVPTLPEPQPVEYHCQAAPLPRLPPVTVSDAVLPEHTVVLAVVMPAAAVELPPPLASSNNNTAFELVVVVGVTAVS